ncbi:MAG TPA: MarR family winged helix-turn-helix transcriptional regulator [Acidimicrobiales bacterium]|jgi:DNA-binding MarR family transcriptional regulator|nr:MarR family winged helix-turn-helix transcriptional regulator [Acidimicrobiales bacterium]
MVVNRESRPVDRVPGRRDGPPGLGGSLRRAWLGYQHRLDEAMAAAGFDDRRFPDGRVLRICSGPAGTTVAQVGRQLGITRQGAAKVVANLRERGYVGVVDSPTSGREKTVSLTSRGLDYLAAQRRSARAIERQLQTELGPEGLAGLHRLLEVLGAEGEERVSDYLGSTRRSGTR